MKVKRYFSKIVMLGVAGIAFLTQPIQAYEDGLEFGFL